MNEKMLTTTLTRTTAPFHDDERLNGYDKKPAPTRPADGFGTDVNNPTTANVGSPIGRNMPAIPKARCDNC